VRWGPSPIAATEGPRYGKGCIVRAAYAHKSQVTSRRAQGQGAGRRARMVGAELREVRWGPSPIAATEGPRYGKGGH
jgi:hypothetical protein